MKVKANQRQLNDSLHHYNERIAQWHHDRNLIDGATSTQQFPKLLEEMIELYADLNPTFTPEVIQNDFGNMVSELYEKGKIKQGNAGNVKDSIGDIYTVVVGIAEREQHPMQECLAVAYHDIKDRKGTMINGVFVKEQDLQND